MIAKDTKNYTGIIMNFRNESEKLPIYEDNQERGRKISIVGSIKGGNLKSHQNTQGLLTQIKSILILQQVMKSLTFMTGSSFLKKEFEKKLSCRLFSVSLRKNSGREQSARDLFSTRQY